MEQPNLTTTNSPTTTAKTTTKTPPKLPTAQELITQYESKGMTTQEASIKAIDDLQRMLLRVVTSSKGKKGNFVSDTSRKLDSINARLVMVEKKLDSKPGFAASFGVGFGVATAFRGVAAVWPQVAGGVVGVWNSVRGLGKS